MDSCPLADKSLHWEGVDSSQDSVRTEVGNSQPADRNPVCHSLVGRRRTSVESIAENTVEFLALQNVTDNSVSLPLIKRTTFVSYLLRDESFDLDNGHVRSILCLCKTLPTR